MADTSYRRPPTFFEMLEGFVNIKIDENQDFNPDDPIKVVPREENEINQKIELPTKLYENFFKKNENDLSLFEKTDEEKEEEIKKVEEEIKEELTDYEKQKEEKIKKVKEIDVEFNKTLKHEPYWEFTYNEITNKIFIRRTLKCLIKSNFADDDTEFSERYKYVTGKKFF